MLISRVAHRGGRHRWRSGRKDSRKGDGGGKRVGGRDLVGEKIEVPEETLPRSDIHRRSFLPEEVAKVNETTQRDLRRQRHVTGNPCLHLHLRPQCGMQVKQLGYRYQAIAVFMSPRLLW